MSVLSLHNVTLDYPDARGSAGVPVLDRLNLHMGNDEFVVVIGRSGSGKTSLLNLVAGFLEPTDGRISVDGRTIAGPGADRAVVFQDDALYPWLDALENVAFPLKLRGEELRARHMRAHQLLNMVGLENAGRKKIWELSGGMRQRVGIARALAAEPDFLLMDEPLGALDALTRARMQGLLLRVCSESGAGALLITHSIDEALLLATRIVVLAPNPGRIEADIRVNFGLAYLSGTGMAEIKASASFRHMHDHLTALIEAGQEEEEAA